MSSEPITKTGMMWKKGGVRHNWLSRYFTLFNGTLCYYPTQEHKTAKGYILTKDITEARPKTNEKAGKKSGKGEFCLEVVTPKRTFYFAPDTAAERDEWIEAIRSWIGKSESAPTKAQPDLEGRVSGRVQKEEEEAKEEAETVEAGGDKEAKKEDEDPDDNKQEFPKYVAQYDYEAQEDNEHSFVEGDIVTVLDTFKGAGWWKAELKGQVALIPGNFFSKVE